MKPALGVFFITLIAYLTTAGGHLYSPDEELMFRMTESLVLDRDLAIQPIDYGFASRKGVDGNEYSQYGVGQPILAIPFFLAGYWAAPLASDDAWARAYGLAGADSPGWWGERASATDLAPRLALSFFNILAGAALAAVLCLLLMEITGHRGAGVLGSLVYSLGSYAWAHSRPFYSESLAVLFIVLSWYFLLRGCRGNLTRWSALGGAAAGYAALVRMDSVILYPATALLLLGPVLRAAMDQRPKLHPYIGFCVPALACGGVILTLNTLHFGAPFEMGYADQSEGIQFSTPLVAGLYGFLFSAGRGMFFFSPALVLGLVGWKELFGRSRVLGLATALAILVPLCFMAKWQNWAGGWTWGPRHIYMLHPFLAIPAAMWLASSWGRVRRGIAVALIVLGAGVQLFGSSQNFILYYQIYYRNANERYYRVMYDFFDQAYWGKFYRLHHRPEPDAETLEVPLTFVPAPVHHSIYFPQQTAWAAYPEMLRQYGTFDNLWWRLLTPPRPPVADVDAEPEPSE